MAGRKPKLTEYQKTEATRRKVAGETLESIAKSYGVDKGTLSRAISQSIPQQKKIAQTIASAEMEMEKYPISQQCTIRALADDLKAMSRSLSSGAKLGAQTFHKLMGSANIKAQMIDDGDMDGLQEVAALTKVANEAAAAALNLLKVNQAIKDDERPTLPIVTADDIRAINAQLENGC